MTLLNLERELPVVPFLTVTIELDEDIVDAILSPNPTGETYQWYEFTSGSWVKMEGETISTISVSSGNLYGVVVKYNNIGYSAKFQN